jgi:hypothetical protein
MTLCKLIGRCWQRTDSTPPIAIVRTIALVAQVPQAKLTAIESQLESTWTKSTADGKLASSKLCRERHEHASLKFSTAKTRWGLAIGR